MSGESPSHSASTACAIVAWGASSALGEGELAFRVAEPGAPAGTRVERDEELARVGLTRPFCCRVPIDVPEPRDRATVLFERALEECGRQLDDGFPGWRSRRVGLAIGTSSGGMRTFERHPGDVALPLESTYAGPVLAASRPCAFEPFTVVLGACASSTIALGIARRWLVDDECDIALAGGFDALGPFVASGFEVLRATSGTPGPRPFRKGRDGLALGEGAAVLALVRRADARGKARAWLRGFGATCDAAHLTAPDRTGSGLVRAATMASADAGIPLRSVDLVSAHGTATPFNDEAESRALVSVFAEDAGRVVVHAFKGTVGHTLGAAGALELLAGIDAMRRGILPASHGGGATERDLRVLDVSEVGEANVTLKLASAFGGANAALLVTKGDEVDDGADAPATVPADEGARSSRPVYVSRAIALDASEPPDAKALAERTGYAEDRIARADPLVRLTIAAVAKLEDAVGSLAGAGIVVGQGLATIETNVAYLERMRALGAARAEPRRFPFTTPNAAAGEASIALRLTGASFAVGGGPHGGIEALSVAASLVRAGVADRIVVVAVDDAGPAAEIASPGIRSGAVALLVSKDPLAGRLVEARVRLEVAQMPGDARATAPLHAHAALLPLAGDVPPDELLASLPWGGFAKARFFWL